MRDTREVRMSEEKQERKKRWMRVGKRGIYRLPGGGTTPNLNTNYSVALPLLILRRFILRTDTANHVDLRGLPSSTKPSEHVVRNGLLRRLNHIVDSYIAVSKSQM